MRYLPNIKKSTLSALCLALLICTSLVLTPGRVGAAPPKSASDCPPQSIFDNTTDPPSCRTPISAKHLPQPNADSSSLKTIRNVADDIIGALALLMITVSGLRYITSAGDPQKASKAKNGIIFALVGIMIAIIANAIVAFVVNGL